MKYSIVTINYNNKEGIRNTIKSVISQSYIGYEFIVIDGGSTDGSVEIIKEYQQNISYWVSEKDNGIYHAMNKGIRAANGEYLIFINSGDTLYNSNVLEDALPYMHHDIVHGVAKNINSPVAPLCLVKVPNKDKLFSPTLHHQACFFKRELFKKTLYDEQYKIVSDWKFYIEQIIYFGASFSYTPLKIAMCEGGGISEIQKELGINERLDVINKIINNTKDKGIYNDNKELILHLIFTSKQRLLIDKSIRDIIRYINTFPVSNKYYKYYPFTGKQKILFFLAEHRIIWALKIFTKII